MILADVLYDLTQHVLVHDTPVADATRLVIACLAWSTALLLSRLYLSHRTGRMSTIAALGAVATYTTVGWAQIVAFSNPVTPRDLSMLNLAVLSAVALSMVGTLQSMEVFLFRAGSPAPSRAQTQAEEVDRIGRVVDAIEGSVNTRPSGEPTISEDVRSIEERGQRDDERRGDESE